MRKRAIRVIYKRLFAASVMYGASVWYELMRYGYGREWINRCQRVVMSTCLNVCRTVHGGHAGINRWPIVGLRMCEKGCKI